MELIKEFSDVTVAVLPIKKIQDVEMLKADWEIEKDISIAQKITDRLNTEAKFKKGKISLTDRFEMAGLGYELKSKRKEEAADRNIIIYRREKKSEASGSYSPVPYSPSFESPTVHKSVMPRARGFFRSTAPEPVAVSSSSSSSFSNDSMNSPRKSFKYQNSNNYYRNNNNYKKQWDNSSNFV
ncbi:unnamed protein product [Caenorhabditis angaria]|uniref:Uncharacterized protein n=1 Tax=Caenorhabditis angaria TaxID=860376 RepID=A0A9P1IHD4_9PELO|nr:unnamed protein product [Caenorhabditis angaria]